MDAAIRLAGGGGRSTAEYRALRKSLRTRVQVGLVLAGVCVCFAVSYLPRNRVANSVVLMSTDSDGECHPNDVDVSHRCQYIRDRPHECEFHEGFIDYMLLHYCTLDGMSYLSFPLLVLFLLFLFLTLGNVAEEFFAPLMALISDTLHLPHNVAGVTFLALGNSAPDLFGDFLAIRGNAPAMGLAALYGGGVMVNVVVIGLVAFFAPGCKVTRRPFLRDAFFLLVVSVVVFSYILAKEVRLWHGVVQLSWYFVYVGVVIIGRMVYLRLKKQRKHTRRASDAMNSPLMINDSAGIVQDHEAQVCESSEDEDPDWMYLPRRPSVFSSDRSRSRSVHWASHSRRGSLQHAPVPMRRTIADDSYTPPPQPQHRQISASLSMSSSPLLPQPQPQQQDTQSSQPQCEEPEAEVDITDNPAVIVHKRADVIADTLASVQQELEKDEAVQEEEEESMSLFAWIVWGVNFPVHVLCSFSVPIPDEEHWNYIVFSLYPLITPTMCGIMLAGPVFTFGSNDSIPLIPVIAAAGLPLSLLFYVWFRRDPSRVRFVGLFLVLGFVAGATWIFLVANELVSLLQSLGIMLNIPQEVLGLTVMAWGNSIPDMVAGVALTKMGYGAMAIGAAFGEPMLNFCISVGAAMLLNVVQSDDGVFHLDIRSSLIVCSAGMIVVLVSHMVAVPLMKFRLRKHYAFYCFTLYAVFVISSVVMSLV